MSELSDLDDSSEVTLTIALAQLSQGPRLGLRRAMQKGIAWGADQERKRDERRRAQVTLPKLKFLEE